MNSELIDLLDAGDEDMIYKYLKENIDVRMYISKTEFMGIVDEDVEYCLLLSKDNGFEPLMSFIFIMNTRDIKTFMYRIRGSNEFERKFNSICETLKINKELELKCVPLMK